MGLALCLAAHLAARSPASHAVEASRTVPTAAGEPRDKEDTLARPDADAGSQGDRGDLSGRVEVGARVMALFAYERPRVETTDLATRRTVLVDRELLTPSVASARIDLKADVATGVRLVLEADLEGPDLKDAFVELKSRRWLMRVGQLKMPISAFELESRWRLPAARRGSLHDFLSDQLGLMGRRVGALGQLKGGGFWDPELTVGVFQPIHWGVDAGDALEMSSPTDAVLVGRFSVSPAGVEIAAVGQRRVTQTMQGTRPYWTAGLDLTGELEFGHSRTRYWAEGLFGSSFIDHDPQSDQTVSFWEARALVAHRWGGRRGGELYLEPFLQGGMLDPDVSNVADGFIEGMGGVNAGHWRRTRLALQLEWARPYRNFPRQYFGAGEVRVRHTAVLVLLGAAI